MDVQRSGIINFDSDEEAQAWLQTNFPVNAKRIRDLQSAMAKNHAVIMSPAEKKILMPDLYSGAAMSIKKEAVKDAEEFARAQMFFGEGAGTRRKLIGATVEHKIESVPGYADNFRRAMGRQNMAQHASAAQKERRRIDTVVKTKKNIKGVLNGDYRSVNISVMVLAAAAYYAHETGYDKKIYAEGKKKYGQLKAKIKNRKPSTVFVQNFYDANKEH